MGSTMDPAVVIFHAKPLHAASDNVLVSWKDGPTKFKSSARRGRPRKYLQNESTGSSRTTKGQRSSSGDSQLPFEFVNCMSSSGDIDAASLKQVRSYVMRQHKRQQQLVPNDKTETPDRPSVSAGHNQHLDRLALSLETIPRRLLTFDAFHCLPLKLEPQALDFLSRSTTSVFEKIYPIEKYAGYNPMKDYFLPMAFDDPATMHAMLFSAGSMILPPTRSRETPNSLFHLRECIRLVNERLRSSPPIVTNSTIIIVATIAFVEKSIGRHRNWEIHMQGLKEIIRLRGGIEEFQSDRILYSKVQRADLCGSMDADSEPYFEHLQPPINVLEAEEQVQFASTWVHLINTQACFSHCFMQVIHRVDCATKALNMLHCGDKSIDAVRLRDELTLVQYAVLRMARSPHQVSDVGIQRICRLGLLLYLFTISNDLPSGVSTCDMIAKSLISNIETYSMGNILPCNFLWWLAFMVVTLADKEENRRWAKEVIEKSMRVNGRVGREHIKVHISALPWVERIHGESFDRFCILVVQSIREEV
ncbi:hypothetical protein BX600DRAFT_475683 [Xylariales sp. PMI_506]|nr:hypothetical protein BX600DRAFT_475683 [Xylariales sp. PMI_506]